MSASTPSRRFETLQLHGGQRPDPTTGAQAVPIYQTTSFVFDDADHAARLFTLEEEGNIYTRIMNPTSAVLEERLALLEGGAGGLATASGQAAVALTLLTLCHQGHEVVAARTLYGGTVNLLGTTLAQYGITTRFVDPADPEAFRAAITPRTRVLFAESIGNPLANVLDLEAVAAVAHQAGLPLVIDNTLASPYLCQPLQHGADIVVHSATKFIGGHGTTIAGVIVDGGQFDWDSPLFPHISYPDNPDQSYTRRFGREAFIVKARAEGLRDLGPCLSPFSAFLLLQGLETLSLRMERHTDNALKVARFLEGHPSVAWVAYPGLESHPTHHLVEKYLPLGAGAVFSFGIRGGREAGKRLLSQVRLWTLLANIGDARSLIIHPATTTHQQLSPQAQQAAGISEDLVRLSVGLEHPDDLLEDLDAGLRAATGEEVPR